MKKILKTQGTLEQWNQVIKLSMDQMGLQTLTDGDNITAYYDSQPLIHFQLSEKDAVFIAIDYLDERDLEDFKLTAANIFANFGKYADAVPKEDQEKSEIPESTEAKVSDKEDVLFQNKETVAQEEPVKSEKKKSKAPIIALIIIGAVLILGAAGFFGYRYYQAQTIPADMLEEALYYYNDLNDYEQAIAIAEAILSEYPTSKQVADAQDLLNNARTKKDEADKQKSLQEAQQRLQSILQVSPISMNGPDADGYIGLTINYTNKSDKEIAAITFSVSFMDGSGQPIVVDDAEDAVVSCNADGPVAAGESAESSWDFYSYDAANVKLVSVYITYSDGSEYAISDEGEVSLIVF